LSKKEEINMKVKFDTDNGTLKPVFDNDSSEVFDAEQKLLGGIDKLKVGNIPIGESLIGGTVAGIISSIVSGAVSGSVGNMGGGLIAPIIKLVGGVFVANSLRGFIGTGGTSTAKLFLTYDALRDVLPLDSIIAGVIPKFSAGQPATPTEFVTATNPNPTLNEWARQG
jgi:hypothetical protein